MISTDYTDIRLYYSFVVICRQLDSKRGWIDFTGAFLGADIEVDFRIQEIEYFLVDSAGHSHVVNLPVQQLRPDILRQLVIVFFCISP